VVAREWIAKNTPTWAATHTSKIVRRLEMYVFPWLGGRPIAEITAPELLAMARRIEGKAQLRPPTGPCKTAGKYSATLSPPDAPNVTQRETFAAHCSRFTSKHMASGNRAAQVAELLRTFDTYQGTLDCALCLAACAAGIRAPW